MKTAKQLERHCKGVANHRRIDILMLIARRDGITVGEIAEALQCNIKTISQHTQSLLRAGLVNKKYRAQEVTHSLSPYGVIFHKFLTSFK